MKKQEKLEPDRDEASSLDKAIQVMRQIHGQDLSVFDKAFLKKSLESRVALASRGSAQTYLQRLAEERSEADALLQSLNVNYSEFFRNPLAFALLEQLILPGLVESAEKSGKGEIRVWSAACADGQEAWSVAILLDELVRERDIPYRIIATDRSESALAKASAGVYSADDLGNVRARQLRKCFLSQDASFAITPRFRKHVNFSAFDLLNHETDSPAASIYGGFDLILCSNVLLYYRPEFQRFILDKLRRSLASGGTLVVGETEVEIVQHAGGFRAVVPPASVFHSASTRLARVEITSVR